MLLSGCKGGISLASLKGILTRESASSLLRAKDTDGRNALMIAALKDRADIIEYIAENYDIDISDTDSKGVDALAIAKGSGSKAATRLLKRLHIERLSSLFSHWKQQTKILIMYRKASTTIQSLCRMYLVHRKYRYRLKRGVEQWKLFQDMWRPVIRVIDKASSSSSVICMLMRLVKKLTRYQQL